MATRDGNVSGTEVALRCPRCRGVSTSWTATGLRCDCGLKVEIKHDGPPNYESDLASHRGSTWSDYPSEDRLERRLRRDDEQLDDVVAARHRPLEIEDVKRVFAGAGEAESDHCPWGRVVQQEVLGTIALVLWGAKPKLGRTWYRRDPNRPPFASLGQALRFRAGDLGLGSLNLEIAETRANWKTDLEIPEWLAKTVFDAAVVDPIDEQIRFAREIRKVGGMRSGHVHAKGSSHNGCVGGAKNASGLELHAVLEKRILSSGVHPSDVNLLAYMHRDGESKPDRRGAMIQALMQEGVLTACSIKRILGWLECTDAKPVVDAALAEHKPRLAKRFDRATKALEHALRREAPDGVVATRRPDGSVIYEQREPTDTPLLKPADEDPMPVNVDQKVLVSVSPIGPAWGAS